MKKKSIIIGAVFVCLLILIRVLGFDSFFTVNTFIKNRDWLLQSVQEQYLISVVSYIGMYIGIVVFSLPAVLLFTVLGGFFFGVIPGMIYANIGATVGSVISYLFVRYSLGDLFVSKYNSVHYSQIFEQFKQQLYRYGAWYLLAVHQIVFIPFGIVNIMAGIMQVPLWTFVWTTTVGIIPAQALFTYVGSTCAHISSLQDLFSPGIVAILCFVSGITILAFILHMRGMRK